MEKLDRPKNGGWFGEGDIVDADLVMELLEAYRFGKGNIPATKIRSTVAVESETAPGNTTETENGEDDNGSQGNKSVSESTSSDSGPILLESTLSETGSNNETSSNNKSGSSNETGLNNGEITISETGSSESSSTNLPNVENEIQHHKAEDGETEEEEEDGEKSVTELEEKEDVEKLLATQENYEIFCPSCSSCITRRVVLKKRNCGEDIDLSGDLEPLNVPVLDEPEAHLEVKKSSNPTESPPQTKSGRERFAVELLKSTVYGGLTETITSLGLVSSAAASGSSTENILALAVANLAGGLILLAQNLQDLRNHSDQEKDRYEGLLGRRANFRMHVLVAVLSYIFFGLIPPLVYAFSFYETGIKNYKLASVFLVSLVCVILLGLIKVYVRKPGSESPKSYLKSAAYYTSIVVASSGISYLAGDYGGEYIGKLGWFSLEQVGITSPFDGIKPDDYLFSSF